MISEMAAVEILGPVEAFPKAVDIIQEAGALHLVETPLAEYGKPGLLEKMHLTDHQAEERETCARCAEVVDAMMADVPAALLHSAGGPGGEAAREYHRLSRASLEALTNRARALAARARSFSRRDGNLAADLATLASYETVMNAFAPLVEEHALEPEFEMIGVVFEGRSRLARRALQEEIRRITGDRFRVMEQRLEDDRLAVMLGFAPEFSGPVQALVARAGIGTMVLPAQLRNKPFGEAVASLQGEMEALRAERAGLRAAMDRFFSEKAAEMIAVHHLVHDHLARYNAMPNFARTRHAFIIHGWLPRGQMPSLVNNLSRLPGAPTDSPVVLREVKPKSFGTPPVRLDNPQPVRSFEPLLSLLPLPRYGSLDPTLFLATFFPPIFGLMLADVGYGALLLGAAGVLALVARGRKLVKSLALIIASCGLFTVVFGLVFGELFGELGRGLGMHPLWQERFSLAAGRSASTLLGYLFLAVAVGVLQVLLGLVLGVVNARRTRDRNLALDNLARIAGLAVLFFVVGRLTRVLPPVFTSVGAVAVLAFLVLMVLQTLRHPVHGFLLPLEILSTMGNILSYARIMAIGTASVVLSLLASMLGGMMGSLLVAVLVIILVNAMNLALGIVDSTIQGLRLHYVEFFTKFYLGGGRPFAPFRKLGGVLP